MAEQTKADAAARPARKVRTGKVVGDKMQKTAYEIMPSLVGSEMCIRDSP